MRPATVVVAHREAMVADALATALSQYPSIMSVAAATSVAEAERASAHADSVVIDQNLAGGAEAVRRLRSHGIRVVVLGDGDSDGSAAVPTQAPVSALAASLVPGGSVESAPSRLTRREEQILELVARGLAGKEVARELGISPKTVEQHKTRIFAKLGVPNQTAAACLAVATRFRMGRPWTLADAQPVGRTT